MTHKDLDERRAYGRKWQAKRREGLANERWARREIRVRNRTTPPPTECAWVAGFFEGEGTVTITKAGKTRRCRPLVSLSSTDISAIDYLHERWPGNRRSFLPKSESGNVRMAHTWNLNSCERIECFLLDILPHIKTERVRQKIDVVLEDIRDRGLFQQQEDSIRRTDERRKIIRQMNAKGLESNIPLLQAPK